MTRFGDAKREEAARNDLPKLIGSATPVGLVLLDDDHREQPVIEGQVIRVGTDSVVFRHDGADEDIPFAIISKRVRGEEVRAY
jgi:hypothetical protein